MRSDGTRSKVGNKDGLRLRIQNFSLHAPAARSVQLVGDFTNWLERPINLRKGSEGTWWKAVRLDMGTHYYRFLVDEQWRDDPECSLFVPNPFGSQNAVRQVP
jgi:1,4-alpha-glucan branching enzyme